MTGGDVPRTESLATIENYPKLREHHQNMRDVPASEGVPQLETLHGRQLTQSAEPHVRGEPLMLEEVTH